MNSTELFDFYRSQVGDVVQPYLWSDDEIWQYMNDAHRMFTRLTEGIPDATSRACCVEAVAGEKWVKLHPSILTVRFVQRASDDRQVDVVNFQDITYGRADDDYGARRAFKLDDTTGSIDYFIMGIERDKARLVHVPEANDTLNLTIYRMPLEAIVGEGQEFEIGEEHHFHLLKWMKHLGYAKEDAETFDRGKSTEFNTEFLAYCARVTAEQQRYRHKPRTVAYGGY